jgi:hypothetical protein
MQWASAVSLAEVEAGERDDAIPASLISRLGNAAELDGRTRLIPNPDRTQQEGAGRPTPRFVTNRMYVRPHGKARASS